MCELILDDSYEGHLLRWGIYYRSWFALTLRQFLDYDPSGYYQFLLDDDGA